jgi:hypothetical protein
VRYASQRLRRQQQQQWPDTLPAAGHQILRNVGNHLNVRGGLPRKLLLDRREIVAQQVEDFFCGRDGQRTHATLD